MRKVLLFIILGFLISCTSSSELDFAGVDSEPYPQKWQLIKMSGQVQDSETTGDNIFWQEHYLLNRDGSFIKVREQDKNTSEAAGTYEILDKFNDGLSPDGKYIIFTYPSENMLIGNCTSELTEHLQVTAENTLIGSWHACDGPGLVYKRVE
jgi:hypothetical protein